MINNYTIIITHNLWSRSHISYKLHKVIIMHYSSHPTTASTTQIVIATEMVTLLFSLQIYIYLTTLPPRVLHALQGSDFPIWSWQLMKTHGWNKWCNRVATVDPIDDARFKVFRITICELEAFACRFLAMGVVGPIEVWDCAWKMISSMVGSGSMWIEGSGSIRFFQI